jgi:PAS domain S-box-containing protein
MRLWRGNHGNDAVTNVPEKPSTRRPAPPVTGRGQAELTDTHSDMFFAAVETTRMPMIVTDPHQHDNPIVFANAAFVQMTGYSSEELVGTNCRFLQGPETDRDTVTEIRLAIAADREFSTEILNYRKDGSTFWNALFISPVRNKAGETVYFFGSQLDVSRRRDAEVALYQAQKMESLGQLTGGIAHDFNNLLQVISGYTDTMLAQLGRPEVNVTRLKRSAETIRLASDRAAKLTQQLLAFARKQRLEGRPINLNTMINGMDALIERTLGDAMVKQLQLAPDLWNCRVDPTQAEVALLNILINARDATPEDGMVTIRTENVTVESEAMTLSSAVQPGSYVALIVTDTGTGMTPDILARVMEPFFTTKGEGQGTGLGLAMVYGFVSQSGGTVTIKSEVGHGTSVRMLFPATELEVQPDRQPSPRASDRGGTEHILVVDDRPEVAEVARDILEDYGYRVTVAHSPIAALNILDEGGKVDMLFSDLIMPGNMNGVMLARAMRELRPKLKVLLTTGYAEASLERTDAGGSEFEVLHKPYRQLELIRRVRRILDGPTGVG